MYSSLILALSLSLFYSVHSFLEKLGLLENPWCHFRTPVKPVAPYWDSQDLLLESPRLLGTPWKYFGTPEIPEMLYWKP